MRPARAWAGWPSWLAARVTDSGSQGGDVHLTAPDSSADAVRQAQPWLAAALLLALGPVLPLLPLWCALAVPALVLLRLLLWWRGRALPRLGLLTLAALLLSVWWLGFERHLAAPPVLALFALALALKWLEADPQHGGRDARLLLGAACVLAALGAVHHVAALSLGLLLAQVPVSCMGLAVLQGATRPLRRVAPLLAMALPLAALMFVLMPRVPGPLWDIGLSFGLPIATTAPRGQGLGARDVLDGTQADSAALEDGTMLVAHFEGYQPAAAEMYWRGPVFWDHDGRRWLPGAGWSSRSERMALGYRSAARWRQGLVGRGEPLRYTLRVAGHGGPWLYALDTPASLPPESYLTHDGQLLSMTPVREETRFQASAWREARQVEPALSPPDRERALALPDGAHPRLVQMGRLLAQRHAEPGQRLAAVLAQFDPAIYRLDPKADASGAAADYDAFLFERRVGGPERYAASAVLLLRAAGVPARLVTGYRGGRLMGGSGYVLVKQSHAHAWAEAWLPGLGWQRLDPVDRLRQPAAARGSQGPVTAGRVEPAPAAMVPRAQEPAAGRASAWALLDAWVVHYNAQRRAAVLQGLGQASQGLPLRPLQALLGVSLLGLVGWFGWRHRPRPAADPLAQSWQELRRRLASVGVADENTQCPSRLIQSLRQQPQAWAAPAAELAHAWCQLRYGHSASPDRPAGSPAADLPAARALAARIRRFRPQAYRSVDRPGR